MDKLRQPIELYFTEPKAAPAGLAQTLRLLRDIESTAQKLAAGPSIHPGFNKSTQDIAAALDKLKIKTRINTADIGRALGLDAPSVEMMKRRLSSLRNELAGISKSGLYFNNVRDAAAGIRKAFDAEIKQSFRNYEALLSPRAVAAGGGGAAAPVAARVEGGIPLLIPAAQVQASVTGMVNLVVPAAQVSGGGVAGRGPDGRFLPGGGGEGGEGGNKRRKRRALGGGSKSYKEVAGALQPGELSRETVEKAKDMTLAVRTLDALGDEVTTFYDQMTNAAYKRTTRRNTRALGARVKSDKEKLLGYLKEQKITLGDDVGALADSQQAVALHLRELIKSPAMKSLPMSSRKPQQQALYLRARQLEAEAQALRQEAAEEQAAQAAREARERQRQAQAQANESYRRRQRQQTRQLRGEARQDRMRRGSSDDMIDVQAAMAMADAQHHAALARRAPPVIPPRQTLAQRLQLADRFNPVNLLGNTLKAGMWGVAAGVGVGTVYKSMELARYGMQRFVEIGLQTARLQQVFRGVGGSAQQLTDDILKLAAANGRSTEEAMDSAVAWSRLGLTRQQVNEAVRVSLVAANVAEMSAADATEHLAAVTAVYKLNVSELNGVLGMFNQTSNTARVRNRDLLEGLSNVAQIGKQAGFSLPELQGILGAGVEATGQSGSRMSNALKTTIARFARPDVQDYLSRRVGIETSLPGGADKDRSQLLREIFMAYQKMTSAERENLSVRLAGANQANRFAAILDSYVRSQELAVNAQLNLNSAQIENMKITDTMSAQWAGLRSEFDRFVVSAGNFKLPGSASIGEYLTSGLRIGKNALGLKTDNDVRVNSMISRLMKRAFGSSDSEGMKMLERNGVSAVRWLDYGLARVRRDPSIVEARFGNRLQELQLRASGLQDESRLFGTISSILETPGGKGAAGIAARLMRRTDAKSAADFESAYAHGDISSARKLLGSAAARSDEQSLAAGQELLRVREELVSSYQSDHDALEKSGAAKSRLLELELKIKEASGENAALAARYADMLGEQDDLVRAHKQEVLNQLAAQEASLRLIERMTALTAGETVLGRMAADAVSAAQQVKMLESDLARLDKSRDQKAYDEVFGRLVAARSRLGAATDPSSAALAQEYDRASIIARRARESGDNAGIGTTEAERLLNREKALRQELAGIERRRLDGYSTLQQQNDDNIRAHVAQNQLLLTQEQIQKRLRDLAAEEKQARLEGQREFARSLLTSGPGELLRKMAAFNIANRKGGAGAGEFFALSPELRGDVDQLTGGETLRRLREERHRLRGIRVLSPEAEAGAVSRFASGNITSQTPFEPAGLDTARTQMELNHVAGSAGTVRAQFKLLADEIGVLRAALQSLPLRLNESAPPAPRTSLNTGYSAGESPGIPGFRGIGPRGENLVR